MDEGTKASAYETVLGELTASCKDYAQAKSIGQQMLPRFHEKIASFSQILLASRIPVDMDRIDVIFSLEETYHMIGQKLYCKKIVPIIKSLEEPKANEPRSEMPFLFADTNANL